MKIDITAEQGLMLLSVLTNEIAKASELYAPECRKQERINKAKALRKHIATELLKFGAIGHYTYNTIYC